MWWGGKASRERVSGGCGGKEDKTGACQGNGGEEEGDGGDWQNGAGMDNEWQGYKRVVGGKVGKESRKGGRG